MEKIHLRDRQFPNTAVHFLGKVPEALLTDDPNRVTCQVCRMMIKHGVNVEVPRTGKARRGEEDGSEANID
jgi:hypothetical protein